MNMIPGTARTRARAATSRSATASTLPLPAGARADDGQPVLYGIRPEHCALAADGPAGRGRRRRADRRRHAALLPLQRPGGDGDDPRSHGLPARRSHPPRARSRSRASVRRGERAAPRRLNFDAAPGIIRPKPSPQPKEECMSNIKRRKFLKASAAVAAERGGRPVHLGQGRQRAVEQHAGKGRHAARAALEALRPGRRGPVPRQRQEIHRRSTASPCASTAKAGRTSGRRRRWRRMPAPAPTSSCRPTTTRISIRTSSST